MCFSFGPSADAPTVRTALIIRVPALNAARATFTTAVSALLLAGCGDAEAPPAAEARPAAVAARVGAAASAADGHDRVAVVEHLGRRGSRLVVVDGAGGRRRVVVRSAVWRGGDVGLAAPAFSPDGTRVAVALSTQDQQYVRRTRVLVIATDGHGRAREVPRLRLADADGYRPAWTPDGRAIAVPDGDGTALVDVATGARRPLLARGGRGLAFAPDGKTYTFDGPGGAWRGVTATGATRRIAAGGRGAVFSPDGTRVAYLSTRDRHGSVEIHEAPPTSAAEVYVARPDGTGARRLTRTTADETGPLRWTLDGKAIVFARPAAGGRLTTRALTLATRCERALDLPAGDLADADLRVSQRWGTSSSSTSSRGTSPHSCSSR
jgi:Tol biopolymer transport system component